MSVDDEHDDLGDFAPDILANAWAAFKGEPTLMLWLSKDSIDRRTADEVQEQLEKLQSVPERLWLWITADGGDPDAAYQIARALQRSAKQVIAVVPRWAKSAATMLALGCHEIVMSPMAELGPLDTQVIVQRHHSRRYGSTLDAHQSVDYLRMFVADSFVKLTETCLKTFNVDEQVAGTMAAQALKSFAEPIFSQVDPGELGEQNRLLTVAAEYGLRLMKVSYKERTNEQRAQVLEKLVSTYPAHSFVIDFQEAQELGLKVRRPDSKESRLLSRCSSFFRRCHLHHQDFIKLIDPTAIRTNRSEPNDDEAPARSPKASAVGSSPFVQVVELSPNEVAGTNGMPSAPAPVPHDKV